MVGQDLGSFLVQPVRIGKSGIGVNRHRECGDRCESSQVVGHEARTGGTVHSDEERLEVFDAGVKGIDRLAGQHRTHRFDGAGDRHRSGESDVIRCGCDSELSGFQVESVLHCFQQQYITSASQ